jgi:hypothetical protein
LTKEQVKNQWFYWLIFSIFLRTMIHMSKPVSWILLGNSS